MLPSGRKENGGPTPRRKTVLGLCADIRGQANILKFLFQSAAWADVWQSLRLSIFTFAEVGLEPHAGDAVVWRLCQERQLILLTANRNKPNGGTNHANRYDSRSTGPACGPDPPSDPRRRGGDYRE